MQKRSHPEIERCSQQNGQWVLMDACNIALAFDTLRMLVCSPFFLPKIWRLANCGMMINVKKVLSGDSLRLYNRFIGTSQDKIFKILSWCQCDRCICCFFLVSVRSWFQVWLFTAWCCTLHTTFMHSLFVNVHIYVKRFVLTHKHHRFYSSWVFPHDVSAWQPVPHCHNFILHCFLCCQSMDLYCQTAKLLHFIAVVDLIFLCAFIRCKMVYSMTLIKKRLWYKVLAKSKQKKT